MALRRRWWGIVGAGIVAYALALVYFNSPATTPLTAEELQMLGAWGIVGDDQSLDFREDRTFRQAGKEIGRWSLAGDDLQLRYWDGSNRFWIPASLRAFDYTVGIEFDEATGTAKISDPQATGPAPVWVRRGGSE